MLTRLRLAAPLLAIAAIVAAGLLIGANSSLPAHAGLQNAILVNTTSDTDTADGLCSLREAIIASNENHDYNGCVSFNQLPYGVNDEIDFGLPGDTPIIDIGQTPLPHITEWTTISGFSGGPLFVEIRGPGGPLVSGHNGLTIDETAAGTTIEGMIVSNFPDDGIVINADEVTIQDTWVGVDVSGMHAEPNQGFGIQVHGNGDRIGNDSIGPGPCVDQLCGRNLISGNDKANVLLDNDSTGAFVRGNYIGVDVSGFAKLPGNNVEGIIDKGGSSTIGGVAGDQDEVTCLGFCNLISGNTTGILVDTNASGTHIVDNYVGPDYSGMFAVRNNVGIEVKGANVTIGGPTQAAGNVISGNSSTQVQIGGTGATLLSNIIGLDVSGSEALTGNGNGVVLVGATNATIGGDTDAQTGNTISGNQFGLIIDSSTNTTVTGNSIGTSLFSTNGIPNADAGILIDNGSTHTSIGFPQISTSENTVANNGSDGIEISGATTHFNTVYGNSIFDNTANGIRLDGGANDVILPPVITGSDPLTGTSCPNCFVLVFSDNADEGRRYEGLTIADNLGNWTFNNSVDGPNATATATDMNGNTSQFSEPVVVFTPTPSPSPTPSPTPTPTPTPTPSPTPTPPVGNPLIFGDNDCSGVITLGDAIVVARKLVNLPVNLGTNCPPLGATATLDGTVRIWGDIDCGGALNLGDSIGIARFLVSLDVNQQQGCPHIGDIVHATD